jgi:hypothetical protein
MKFDLTNYHPGWIVLAGVIIGLLIGVGSYFVARAIPPRPIEIIIHFAPRDA